MLTRLVHGSIRKKLAVLFLFSALPTVAIIVLTGLQHRREAIHRAEQELLTFSRKIAESQVQATTGTRTFLEALASLPEVRKADAAACTLLFSNIAKLNPNIGALHLVDTKGGLIASGNAKAPANFSHTKHFRDALATKSFATGEYLVGVTTRIPVFTFGHPVLDDAGQTTGVLLTSIRLDRYGELFRYTRFPDNSFVGICDHNGIRLYRFPENPSAPTGKAIKGEVFEAARKEHSGLVTEVGSDGVERIHAYQQLRLGPGAAPYMYIIVGEPKATIFSDVRKTMTRDAGLLMLIIGLTLLSGWYLGGKKISLSLEKLGAAAKKIGTGDYSVRVDPVPEIAEVDVLAKAFNSMAQSLSQDIAERERAEERLKESELRFKALHNASFGGIAIHDQGVILDCNQGLSTISGYAYDELIGMDGLLLIAEQSRAVVRANIRAGYEKPYEVFGLRKNNEIYPVRLEARNIPYLGKQVRVVEFRDITESKLAEERLRQSEERLALALDATNDGLWDWNLETGETYFSPRYATMLGYEPDELEFSFATWESLLHPEDLQKTKRVVVEHIERGEPFTVEFRLKTKDGTWLWVLGRGKVMERDASGRPTRMVGTHVDINARKLAEISWHQLTQILENSDSIAVMKDTDLRYLAVNQAYLRLTGFTSAKDVTGKTDADLFRGLTSAEHIAEYMENDRKALALPPGQILSAEESMTGADGAIRTFLTKKFPVYDRERTLLMGVATLTSEITDRKRMEVELRAAKDAAEKASQAKSEFLANMSHEIRTPLNGITGMLQLLETSPLSTEQHEFCLLAIQSTTRLTQLLSDILDLSRVEAGKMQIRTEPFNLPDALGQALDLFLPIALQSGVALEHHIDATLPQTVVGDSTRLQQVLTNLLGNAFKFTPSGQVTLEAYPLQPCNDTETRVIFSVTDTGCGIADEDLARLFQPFTQISQGFTKNHQGAGLGLAISKHLVRLMGGNMAIESEPGVGTSVYFCIAFGREGGVHAATPPTGQHLAPSRTLRVLLAEDDEVTRFSVRRLLEKAGHYVTVAHDGQEAVDLYETEDFDLILMDVQMPDMDGVEATRAIRQSSLPGRKKDIPIIAMTAYSMAGDKEKFLAAGMNAYIAKPIGLDALLHTMATELRSGND
jgi:PAS domain S-box-containing protein